MADLMAVQTADSWGAQRAELWAELTVVPMAGRSVESTADQLGVQWVVLRVDQMAALTADLTAGSKAEYLVF
jgi:uncharacterized protein YfcZ (UPF0381/DUF406 family)